jgi:hypothetical protein
MAPAKRFSCMAELRQALEGAVEGCSAVEDEAEPSSFEFDSAPNTPAAPAADEDVITEPNPTLRSQEIAAELASIRGGEAPKEALPTAPPAPLSDAVLDWPALPPERGAADRSESDHEPARAPIPLAVDVEMFPLAGRSKRSRPRWVAPAVLAAGLSLVALGAFLRGAVPRSLVAAPAAIAVLRLPPAALLPTAPADPPSDAPPALPPPNNRGATPGLPRTRHAALAAGPSVAPPYPWATEPEGARPKAAPRGEIRARPAAPDAPQDRDRAQDPQSAPPPAAPAEVHSGQVPHFSWKISDPCTISWYRCPR